MVRASASEEKYSGGLIEEGGHHCMVEDAKAVTQDNGPGQVQVELIVLASTDESQVGRKKMYFLDYEGEKAWKWFDFAVAVGLISQQQYEASKRGEVVEADETLAIGRQCCIEVRKNEFKAKRDGKNVKAGETITYFDYDRRIWAVDDKRAAAIPKEPAAYGTYMKAKERALAARGQQLTQSGGMTANGTAAVAIAANGGQHAPQQQQVAGSGVLGGWSDDEASQF